MKYRLLCGLTLLGMAAILLGCSPAPTATATLPAAPVSTAASTFMPTMPAVVEASPTAAMEPVTDGALARKYLDAMSEIGSRKMGSTGHEQAARYLTSAIQEMGYTPTLQPFTNKGGDKGNNILFDKAGISSQVLIVGAHYDSVDNGKGYDDNASGVAVLLEAASRVQQMETPYTIHFILFDSEETNLEGSTYYVDQMDESSVKNTIAMVNLDSLAVGDYTYIYGTGGTDGHIRDWALDYAKKNNLNLITQGGKNPELPAGTTGDWSDHAPFLHKGIEYAYFEATNWDLGDLDGYTQVNTDLGVDGEVWHTEFDNKDYIQSTFPGRDQEHLALFSNVLTHILTDYTNSK